MSNYEFQIASLVSGITELVKWKPIETQAQRYSPLRFRFPPFLFAFVFPPPFVIRHSSFIIHTFLVCVVQLNSHAIALIC